jgi:hypothetical protein
MKHTSTPTALRHRPEDSSNFTGVELLNGARVAVRDVASTQAGAKAGSGLFALVVHLDGAPTDVGWIRSENLHVQVAKIIQAGTAVAARARHVQFDSLDPVRIGGKAALVGQTRHQSGFTAMRRKPDAQQGTNFTGHSVKDGSAVEIHESSRLSGYVRCVEKSTGQEGWIAKRNIHVQCDVAAGVYAAAFCGDFDEVLRAIESVAQLEQVILVRYIDPTSGWTLLHQACYHASEAACIYLAQHGADRAARSRPDYVEPDDGVRHFETAAEVALRLASSQQTSAVDAARYRACAKASEAVVEPPDPEPLLHEVSSGGGASPGGRSLQLRATGHPVHGKTGKPTAILGRARPGCRYSVRLATRQQTPKAGTEARVGVVSKGKYLALPAGQSWYSQICSTDDCAFFLCCYEKTCTVQRGNTTVTTSLGGPEHDCPQLCPTGTKGNCTVVMELVAQLWAQLQRGDAQETTILRTVATTRRSGDIWHASHASVSNGEWVQLLRDEAEFHWVRTTLGEEGYLNSRYVRGERRQADAVVGCSSSTALRFWVLGDSEVAGAPPPVCADLPYCPKTNPSGYLEMALTRSAAESGDEMHWAVQFHHHGDVVEAGPYAAIPEGTPPEPEPEPEPQLTVAQWLQEAKLCEYLPVVEEEGYNELEFLLDATETDIQEFVDGLVHAKRMKKPHARAFVKAWARLSSLSSSSGTTGGVAASATADVAVKSDSTAAAAEFKNHESHGKLTSLVPAAIPVSKESKFSIFGSMRFGDEHGVVPMAQELQRALADPYGADLHIINMKAGGNINTAVFSAIEHCDTFLVFGSAAYGENTGNQACTYYEYEHAFSRKKNIILIRMIPRDQDFDELQGRVIFGANKLQLAWAVGEPMPVDLPNQIADAMGLPPPAA